MKHSEQTHHKMYLFARIFILMVLKYKLEEEYEICFLSNNIRGKCIDINSCPKALEEIKQQITPTRCDYYGSAPVVCCAFD